jgi:CrcB protein
VTYLGIATTGAIGALARYLVDRSVRRRLGANPRWRDWPIGTLIINLTGSLLLGFVTGLVLYHDAPATALLLVGTGFCGGYTTYSTFAFESVGLSARHEQGAAVAYVAVSIAGGLVAAAVGLAVAALG